MDILKTIKEQIAKITKGKPHPGLNSVLAHIERAEKFLELGLSQKEEEYFTDVIYRTNQAFEGSLKEAYVFLTGKKDTSKITPYKIEQYLMTNNVFSDRVLEQFTNYRQKWRNPSTHDHKLFFSHSESFLAIISVLAFIHLLLNQIVEKISYNFETETIKKKGVKIGIAGEDDFNKIISVLMNFTLDQETIKEIKYEVELNGMLNSYLENSGLDLQIIREAKIVDNIVLRPDFVIDPKDSKIIIEVKRNSSKSSRKNGIDQVLNYLYFAKSEQGILYIAPNENSTLMEISKYQMSLDNEIYEIAVIEPKK